MRLVCCLPSLLGVGVASVFAAVEAPGGACVCVCGSGASGKTAFEAEIPGTAGSERPLARDGATVQAQTKIAAVKQRCLNIWGLRFRPSLRGCKRLLLCQTIAEGISFHYQQLR